MYVKNITSNLVLMLLWISYILLPKGFILVEGLSNITYIVLQISPAQPDGRWNNSWMLLRTSATKHRCCVRPWGQRFR